MKDDLISRKQIMDEAKRLSGPITGDGWDNWGVYALIERQPSVPAVPLDKLCEWLERNAAGRWNGLEYTAAGWKDELTRWMEEQHNENHEYSEVCAICIVCRKSTPRQYSVLNDLICEDCKRAILYAKEKMMEEQDADRQ